ncbi:MAG: hypothetical protein U0821_07230 [Chloroflexota bacterium]
MQSVVNATYAGAQLILLLIIGWVVVYIAGRYTERRLRKQQSAPSILGGVGVLFDYSNVVGIPVLLLGTAYLVWAMAFGGGLGSGPTALVILFMTLAGLLIGFGPGLRR